MTALDWNPLLPHRYLPDQALSATSVVTMASLSSVTALARAATGSLLPPALLCWGAAAPVVCIGAPLGSLLLTETHPSGAFLQRAVRATFYLLALAQLPAFAALQPHPAAFYPALAVGMGAVALLLAAHRRLVLAKPVEKRVKRA